MKTKPNETEATAVRVGPHINVTPLIDVLLVLLIIFMVITPLKPSRFKALVPQKADARGEPDPLALIVTIERNLQLKLNESNEDLGTVNETSRLSAALADTFARRKVNRAVKARPTPADLASGADLTEKTVMIKAPRSIAYGDVAKVIDGIKGAGAAPIGLQIDDLTP